MLSRAVAAGWALVDLDQAGERLRIVFSHGLMPAAALDLVISQVPDQNRTGKEQ